MANTPPTLSELFLAFFRVGSLAFGGGGSTLAMIHSEFCTRREVVPEEEFQLLFSLSRLVPGMNLLALTVLLGHHTRGLLGSLVALAGLTLPSFSIIVVSCVLVRAGHRSPAVAGIMRGLAPAVAGLLVHTLVEMCLSPLRKQSAAGRAAWTVIAAAAAILAVPGLVNPAWLVVGGGLAGLACRRWVEPAK